MWTQTVTGKSRLELYDAYAHTHTDTVRRLQVNKIFLQVADGLATPLVGIAMDNIGIKRYGKRKTWHGLGTVLVAVSFAFMFHKCFGCEGSSTQIQQLYYGYS